MTIRNAIANIALVAALAAPATAAHAAYGYGRFHDVASDFCATFLGRAAVDELVKLGEKIGAAMA